MQNKKYRILFIEDDRVDLMAFERFARGGRFPYDYITTGSMKEASSILESEEFDAIVADYSLGDGTAFDLFDRIEDTPMIIVTGAGDEEIAVQAMKSGAHDYLIKDSEGHHLEVLSTTVENAIRYKQAEDELRRYREHLEDLVKERTAELQAEITERKKAEEMLAEERNLLRTLIDNLPDSVYVKDAESRFVIGNIEVARRVRVKTPDQLIGKTDFDLHPQELAAQYYADEQEVIRSGQPLVNREEQVIDQTTGNRIWNLTTKVPLRNGRGRVVGIVGMGRDITERKQAEEAVRESEEKYRELFDNMLNGFAYCKMLFDENNVPVDFMYLEINDGFERLTGLKKEDVLGKKVTEAIPGTKEAHPELFEIYGRVALTGEPTQFDIFFRPLEIWLSISVYCPRKGYFVAIFDNITERKHMEEALRTSELQYRTTLDSISDAIHVVDTDLRLVLLNRAFTQWIEEFGLETDVIGGGLFKAFPFLSNGIRDEYHWVFDTAEILITEETTKIGDREFVTLTQKLPIVEEGRVVRIVTVVRDITKERRVEEELLKIEKLESIGTLAGGIAHDFNNILTGILGNISLAEMYMETGNPPGKVLERLKEAERASMQAKDLTQQLLTFSKGGAPIKKMASIADLLRDSATFALRGSNVRCEFSIPGDLWSAEVDEGQINQVISNLIINADQAMASGGVIKVCVENVTIGAEDDLPLEDGEYVKISIQDQGIGISEDHLPRIFDPYFTTKQKGSGLGLATSYSIVKNHDGHITVESQLGVGTTFHIHLPASPGETLTKKEEVEKKLIMGEGKILVMDDEKHVRDSAGEMLSSIGYKVTTAIDGAEAVEMYQEAKDSGQPYDVVIIDLTIAGGMGGKEAIQKLIKIDHEVKAIVSSGYSNDPVMADFRRYGFKGVIAKPYKTGELSEVLHRVMMGTSD